MRLDKFMSNAVGVSRTDTKKLVKAGRITVNGILATKSDISVDEHSDNVALDGENIKWRDGVYIMLNKPSGYVSATFDKKLPVVTDLVSAELAHFDPFPVGRLDIDTTGLLILSNDGTFAHEVTSPKKQIYKTYIAQLDAPAQEDDIEVFKKGINLGDFVARPAVLEIDEDNPCIVTVKICEGKFHQVKRMCEKVGKHVVSLKRVSIGRLRLDDNLSEGKSRELTDEEITLLYVNEDSVEDFLRGIE